MQTLNETPHGAEGRGIDGTPQHGCDANQAPPSGVRPTLDKQVLAELYHLHGHYLLRALLRLTNGDRGRSEDIVQETMIRAWQHPEAISRGPEHSRPWLFTVARRIAIDHFRMQASRVKEVASEVPEDGRVVADPFDEVLSTHDIQAALAELTPQHREILIELHLRGRSVLQAAHRLGIPPGTVKSRSFYAMRALRPVLEERGFAASA